MTALLVLRTALGTVFLALSTLVHAFFIGLFGHREGAERVLRSWCRQILAVTGSRLIVRSDPSIDPARSYVFVANHTSALDVPAILAETPVPLRFVAKRELSWVPLFGWAAKRMGHVFINRRDMQGAARAIQRRIDRGLSGIGLLFFAEGTRATEDALLPFKKGAAIAALQTGLDCVPVAVAGARDVMQPKGFSVWRPGPVAVVFGKPIPIAGHTLDGRDALVAEQVAAVQAALEEARALVREVLAADDRQRTEKALQ